MISLHARVTAALTTAIVIATFAIRVDAHDGPPFPIVSDAVVGPYRVSVWTDPDSTDDGSAGGRFWVTVRPEAEGLELPADTRADVSLTPIDRSGETLTARTELLDGDVRRQFAALVMDHEGRFRVRVAIMGPIGPAAAEADVDATFDLRPPPILIIVYLMPFLLIGFLWVKLLVKRRLAHKPHRASS